MFRIALRAWISHDGADEDAALGELGMAMLPVDWGFSVPYGIVYAKDAAPHVTQFAETVADAIGR